MNLKTWVRENEEGLLLVAFTLLFCAVYLLFSTVFVSAETSVNYGGNDIIVITEGGNIESFFFGQIPSVSIAASSSGTQLSKDSES